MLFYACAVAAPPLNTFRELWRSVLWIPNTFRNSFASDFPVLIWNGAGLRFISVRIFTIRNYSRLYSDSVLLQKITLQTIDIKSCVNFLFYLYFKKYSAHHYDFIGIVGAWHLDEYFGLMAVANLCLIYTV